MEVEYRPFLLRPDLGPEGAPRVNRDPERARASRQHLLDMAQEAGLQMNFRDHTSYSRLALEAQEFAVSRGQVDAFHRAMFDAYWRDARDIGDIGVVLEVAGSVGLDPAELRPVLEQRTLQAQVEAQLEEARRMRISAVPSFIFNEQYLVQGAQPYEIFQRVMREYVLVPRQEGEG